jgi:hypothetical protein
MTEMITETVADSDVIGGTNCIVDLIAALQAKLETIPEQFRGTATLEICAYDWDGSHIEYERPITDAEIADRAARIEAQRQRAAKASDDRQLETWLRNIRIAGITDRDEAMEFLRTDPDANNYHPDVYHRSGNHGHA